jgi:lysozyme family protein
MAKFEPALIYLLKHEGGWSDDPADPGGATNFGITLEKAKAHGITTKDELLKITPAQVAGIYRTDYWYFNGVDDQRVATKIFDACVNMQWKGNKGPVIRMVQSAMNDLGAGLVVDGYWGPKTEGTVNAIDPSAMLSILCEELAEYYRHIVERRPESAKFLKGWLRRANDVPEE